MKLSRLQKFILKQSLLDGTPKITRKVFENFYANQKKSPNKKIQANIITKSIERLIDKGLLVGFGEKTQYKLFINQVKLTPRGKKTAQAILGQQAKLPFSKSRSKK